MPLFMVKKEEGSLEDILRQDNYKNIIPIAQSLQEAITYLKKLYGTVEKHSQHIILTCRKVQPLISLFIFNS